MRQRLYFANFDLKFKQKSLLNEQEIALKRLTLEH